jgi:DNA-directed RNA polymerase specialized sigma24 family protein
LAWLARTASREAFRLIRRGTRELSLDALLEAAGDCALPPAPACLEETCEARDRLGSVRRLSVRQQRMLWLHAIGLSYAEMAVHEGCTRRTVERQLLRAKDAVRQLGTE